MLVDTGPIVAVGNTKDRNHRACVELLRAAPGPLMVPEFCLAEAAYLLGKRVGVTAEARLAATVRNGEIRLIPTEQRDWPRIAELTEKYLDLPLGITDAVVIAIAERLRLGTVATTDRKHFSIVRPNHIEAFEILP